MSTVIRKLKASPRFKNDFAARKEIIGIVYSILEEEDWDTEDECYGEDPAYDELFLAKYPDYEE